MQNSKKSTIPNIKEEYTEKDNNHSSIFIEVFAYMLAAEDGLFVF